MHSDDTRPAARSRVTLRDSRIDLDSQRGDLLDILAGLLEDLRRNHRDTRRIGEALDDAGPDTPTETP